MRPCANIFLIEMAVRQHPFSMATALQASESVVAAHFSVAGPVVKVTILRSRLTGGYCRMPHVATRSAAQMAWHNASTSLLDREGPRQGICGVCRHRSRRQGAHPLWIHTAAASNKGANPLSSATVPKHVDGTLVSLNSSLDMNL